MQGVRESTIVKCEGRENEMSNAEHHNDNALSVFWWGLLVCLILGFIVYLIG